MRKLRIQLIWLHGGGLSSGQDSPGGVDWWRSAESPFNVPKAARSPAFIQSALICLSLSEPKILDIPILKWMFHHTRKPFACRATADKFTVKRTESNAQYSMLPGFQRAGSWGSVPRVAFYCQRPAVQRQKFKIKNNISADSLHNCYLVLLILWLNYNLLKPWRFACWFISLNLHWHAFQSSE